MSEPAVATRSDDAQRGRDAAFSSPRIGRILMPQAAVSWSRAASRAAVKPHQPHG